MRAEERIWLTADRKAVVSEGHPKAAFLWAAEGDEIPEADAERFGLRDGRIAHGPAKPEPLPDTPELRARLAEIFEGLNPETDFTQAGHPKADVVAEKIGAPVLARVIRAAWEEKQKETEPVTNGGASPNANGAKSGGDGENKSGRKGGDKSGGGKGEDKGREAAD